MYKVPNSINLLKNKRYSLLIREIIYNVVLCMIYSYIYLLILLYNGHIDKKLLVDTLDVAIGINILSIF